MPKPRILIVDDEPLARERVRRMLGGDTSVEILGECENGVEALASIHQELPEIIFLDVEMPGCGGLELLARIPLERRPAIVVTTAHERFAVDAFSAQVVDYLLKPFDAARLRTALKRATDYVDAHRVGDLALRLESMLTKAPVRSLARLLVKCDGRTIFVDPKDIVWVEADGNYCALHLAGAKRLLVRESLSSLEKRLGDSSAVRVNRSALVNREQVQELQPAKYGDHVVLLRNGVRLPLSRNLRGRLEATVTDEA